jgi:Sir2- and TIR-associating SLOG family/SIR2-like domain
MKAEALTPEQRTFVRKYSKYLESGDAGLFAGAGLSRAAGFVDWKGLLEEIAKDLGLDVNREPDLIALAQYDFNYRRNRSQLSEAIIENFAKQAKLTPNHYLLARLPLQTIWTTNYDQLIERAFGEAGKVVDVKLQTEDFTLQKARDLILYKMHGDVQQPYKAVLTKDDYENYEKDRPLFLEHLRIDLVTKTFLFLGFSFTDPNLEYVLSRVRVLLRENVRQHFAIIREPAGSDTYEHKRLEYWKIDLRRFGVEIVTVRDYSEIEKLLSEISFSVHRKNVFVSGSSRQFDGDSGGPRSEVEKLGRLLGQRLIEKGCNLVSGFGVGIGEQCVIGALRALYAINDDARQRVIIRPFPTAVEEEEEQRRLNTRTRRDLISRAGAAVFIAGNKIVDGKTLPSGGVLEEFRIAKEMRRFIIPVGATGDAAEMIWNDVSRNPGDFYAELDVSEQLARLNDRNRSVEELAETVIEMVQIAAKAREG